MLRQVPTVPFNLIKPNPYKIVLTNVSIQPLLWTHLFSSSLEVKHNGCHGTVNVNWMWLDANNLPDILVADQLGNGGTTAICQIPYVDTTYNLEHNRTTLSQRVHDIREKWLPCEYDLWCL